MSRHLYDDGIEFDPSDECDPEVALQAADDAAYARRFGRVRAQFPSASDEDITRFLDLRDEGRSTYQASVMAGLADPS